MKRYFRNIFILISPLIFMVLVNESVRITTSEKPGSYLGVSTINSKVKTPEKCSWICHHNTTYCKQNHVKMNKKYFLIIDPIYFGIITLLGAFGNYGMANIIFLVTLFPLTIYFLIIKVINQRSKIKELKSNERINPLQ